MKPPMYSYFYALGYYVHEVTLTEARVQWGPLAWELVDYLHDLADEENQ